MATEFVMDSKAWAVDTNEPKGSYLGIYAFDPHTKTEAWQDGCRVALFRTRDEARMELKKVHARAPAYFSKATVRRVTMTLTSR